MDRDYHHIRFLLRDYLVYVLLDKREKVFELHPAPEPFGEPVAYVGVVESKYRDPDAPALKDGIHAEIRLPVVVPYGIPREERNPVGLEVARHSVIYLMACLDVVVSHCHGIISHVLRHPWIDMGSDGVHIVEVICRIVSLEDVPCIDQYDILLPNRGPDAVHGTFDGNQ